MPFPNNAVVVLINIIERVKAQPSRESSSIEIEENRTRQGKNTRDFRDSIYSEIFSYDSRYMTGISRCFYVKIAKSLQRVSKITGKILIGV